MKPSIPYSALVALLLLGASPLPAQDYVIWSGGFGADERERAPREGTRLEFFAERGEFIAQVKVRVQDSSDKLLVDTISEGPWLILNLPDGRYRVTAEAAGSTQSAMIEVGRGQRSFGFRFTLER